MGTALSLLLFLFIVICDLRLIEQEQEQKKKQDQEQKQEQEQEHYYLEHDYQAPWFDPSLLETVETFLRPLASCPTEQERVTVLRYHILTTIEIDVLPKQHRWWWSRII